MKHWKKIFFILLATLGIGYCFFKPPVPLEVAFTSSKIQYLAEYIEEEGKTQLKEDRKIFPTLAGYLGPVQVDIGDRITEGQLLAQIDPFSQKQEISALKAEIQGIQHKILGLQQSKPKKSEYVRSDFLIEQAKTQIEVSKKDISTLEMQLDFTQREYNRIKGLSTQGISTTQDLDNITTKYRIEQENLAKAKAQLSIAQQNFNIANANLNLLKDAEDDQDFLEQVYQQQIQALQSKIQILENDIKKANIIAPFSGIVLERITRGNVHLSFVMPDYYILRIGDLDTIEIRADILSDDIPKIKEGQKALVFGPALGKAKIMGKVSQIYPTAFTKLSSLGIEQQRVTVIIEIPKDTVRLYPGYRVDVRIFTREVEKTLVIPSRAVFSLAGQKHCFVVQENRAKLQPIKVGIETEEETEVSQGLENEQTVIVDPPNDLTTGRFVRQKS